MRWNFTAEEIAQRTTDLIAKARKVYDGIGALTDKDVNYENTIRATADLDVSFSVERYTDYVTKYSNYLFWLIFLYF